MDDLAAARQTQDRIREFVRHHPTVYRARAASVRRRSSTGHRPTTSPPAMNKDEKRRLRRERLMGNKAYQAMKGLTRCMDRYYLDALIGVIPGWGDAIAMLSAIPFVYFSVRVIRSMPLTLAILNNTLRDVLLGMIPFFVGDIIDVFHRANTKNMAMIQGFVDGDEAIIREVNKKARQSAVVLILLLLLIALMIWLLITFGSYLYSLVASLFQQ